MNSHIPLWEALLSLDSEYWFLTAPMVFGLLVLALRGPNWLGRFRWGGLVIAVPMAMPFALTGMVEASKLPLTRTLSGDEIVAGQLLYAGSVVRFRDRKHTYVEFIKLQRVTEIDGIPFTGTVGFASGGDTPGRWYGTLAADHVIGGWPCARGQIATRWGNKLLTCKLATAQIFFDFEVPAGTTVFGGWKVWSFELPPDEGLAIKALSTIAPAGSIVGVTSDGRLQRINLKSGQTIAVHEVPLRGNIEAADEALVGELAQPFVIEGAQRAAGTTISIDLKEEDWPCEGERVRLPQDGSFWSCRLTSERAFFGYDLPAGTTVLCLGAKYTWQIILPPDKGLAIDAISTTVPGGVALWITDEGELWKISSRADEGVVVRGVPLSGDIYVLRGSVRGEIAEAVAIDGHLHAAGTEVAIDLSTGTICSYRVC